MPDTDRIQKQIELAAPLERVWRAICDAAEFGTWFGLDFSGVPFEAGTTISAKLTEPPEYAGMEFPMQIERVDAPRLFAFRWHPGVPDPDDDLGTQPTTLVEFTLEPRGEGTVLTVTESGFDALPEQRRAASFRSNSEGWEIQLQNISKHVGG